MSVLVDKNTRLLVQGITGKSGAFHARGCRDYGTNVVAGVTPGRGGEKFDETIPVFDTVAEARKETGCNATMIFVPPPGAADGILEAADAGVELIVCITEGIPVHGYDARQGSAHDQAQRPAHRPELSRHHHARAVQDRHHARLYSQARHDRRHFRSGTLTYEAVWQLTSRGYGQSTCIGIGGDPINGTSHLDAVKLFAADEGTEAFILIGEIGGSAEEEAAAWIAENCQKPVAAFIAGATAPPGRRMGHAGAIVSGGQGTAEGKIAALEKAGIAVAKSPAAMADTLIARMKGSE